jgi:hypothetical protein
METIKLKKQARIAGEETTELVLDFEALTGCDAIDAHKEFNLRNQSFVGVAAMEPEYQAILAGKALGCSLVDLINLPLNDFNTVVGAVARFLFEADLVNQTKS